MTHPPPLQRVEPAGAPVLPPAPVDGTGALRGGVGRGFSALDEPDHFDPNTGALTLTLALPPSANNLHRASSYGSYPTQAYKDWLSIEAPKLRELLGEWEPDGRQWWQVSGELHLGGRADAHNYLKATLDLLGGAHVVAQSFTDDRGKKIQKGSIRHEGALWDSDQRVCIGGWLPRTINHPTPYLTVCVVLWLGAPRDLRAEATAERDNARQNALRTRQQAQEAKARETERKRQEHEEKEAERWFVQQWRWATVKGMPRVLRAERQDLSLTLCEVGPLLWADQERRESYQGTAADVKKAALRSRWEAERGKVTL